MNLKHLQTLNQLDLKLAIGEIVEKRIFRKPPRLKMYAIKPRCFYLVERKGELACVWNGNYRRKSDIILGNESFNAPRK